MNPFSKLHGPRWKPPPGCMSCAEIRWWMLELQRRGWNRGEMQRTLGMPNHDWRKALGKEWIYPTEQMRYSRQLRKIMSGELVLRGRLSVRGVPVMNRYGTRVRDAVLADEPVPLQMPMKMAFDMKTGRIGLLPKYLPPENPLPSFRTLLANAQKKFSCP